MDPLDYIIGWIVYLVASIVLAIMFWRVFKKYFYREFAYIVEGFLLATLFTPWYVLADQEILAPAFIIFLMDTLAEGLTAGIRSLIPLVMAIFLSIIISITLSIIYRVKKLKTRLADRKQPIV